MTALFFFAVFSLSPTPGAAHGCEAWMRSNVPVPCVGEQPPPCLGIGPMVPVPCAVDGNAAYALEQPLPGQAFAFCIYAENSAGRSGCAEPVMGIR